MVDIGGGSTELVWIDLSAVTPNDRPAAIMRLHTGFREQAAGPARGAAGGAAQIERARRLQLDVSKAFNDAGSNFPMEDVAVPKRGSRAIELPFERCSI